MVFVYEHVDSSKIKTVEVRMLYKNMNQAIYQKYIAFLKIVRIWKNLQKVKKIHMLVQQNCVMALFGYIDINCLEMPCSLQWRGNTNNVENISKDFYKL